MKKGDISEPVNVFQDLAIIQLVDTRPTQIEPFEKIEAKVTQKYKELKASEKATEEAQKFYESIGSSNDLKAAAEKAKLDLKSSDEFTKEGYISDLGQAKEVNDKAFSLKQGEISGPVKAGQNVVVFQLKEKKEFNSTDFAKEKNTIRDQLLSTKQSTFLQGYRAMLRKKYEKEIWINEAAINPQET
jgi:parvulin-like peptidyl-prolyl isomerase